MLLFIDFCYIKRRNNSPSWTFAFWSFMTFLFWVIVIFILYIYIIYSVRHAVQNHEERVAKLIMKQVYALVWYPAIIFVIWTSCICLTMLYISNTNGISAEDKIGAYQIMLHILPQLQGKCSTVQ